MAIYVGIFALISVLLMTGMAIYDLYISKEMKGPYGGWYKYVTIPLQVIAIVILLMTLIGLL